MATVYYSDGTFKKYKYKCNIAKEDKFLKCNDKDTVYFHETIEDEYSHSIKGNEYYLEQVKIEDVKKRIAETNSININGLYAFANYKVGWTYVNYPMIDKNIISQLEDMFPNITKLKLSHNNLEKDDINFLKFKKLKVIHLNRNKFYCIPPDFCYLSNLKVLKMKGDYCFLERSRCTDVEEFKIPNYINKLKNLEVLDLSDNNIKTLPPEFFELTKLRKINFSDTLLKELPKEIGNLINLTEILLLRTECKIPKEIGKLKNLINFEGNGYEVFTDKWEHYVPGIKFCDLPVELWNCNKLKELHIDSFGDTFNKPTLLFKKLLELKKDIHIVVYDYDYKPTKFTIIHNKNDNDIICKGGYSRNKIFNIIDNKLYRKIGSKLLLCNYDNDCDTRSWEDESNFSNLKNPTRKECIKVIINNGLLLEKIRPELQTEKICLLAVSENGLALKYVSPILINDEIRLEAVKENGMALQFIRSDFQTEEICLAAIKKDGYAIEYVGEKLLTKKMLKISAHRIWYKNWSYEDVE